MIVYREPFTMLITVDEYPLPYIERYPGTRPDGGISLTLDSRFGLDTTEEECERWLPFLANAMAVAAGRTSHGANSNIRNPHGEALAGYPTERIMGSPSWRLTVNARWSSAMRDAAPTYYCPRCRRHTSGPICPCVSDAVRWKLVIPSGSVHGIYDSREAAEKALRNLTKDIPPGTAMAGAFMILEVKP